ncbi:MAG: hypothetical protein ABUS54_14705 [Actinomycetota bacterium]
MKSDRIRARDAAVRRLRLVTAALGAAAGALALVFGVLASKAFPGHSTTVARTATLPAAPRATRHPRQSAPTLVQAGSPAPTQQQQPAASPPPSPTPAPPVAVSGGS